MDRGEVFYATAKNCTNLMLFLVKDILDFSQIESKSILLNIGMVNLSEMLKECLDLFKFKANEK